MRLNRYLALAGVASRRGADEVIRGGRVTVNGQVISDLSTQVSPADHVKVDGRRVRQRALHYVLLNKPRGYLTARSDDRDRKTIYNLLPRGLPELAHVGRLDLESEGLLLLTNDGELALRMTHPRYKLEKEYLATLDRDFDMADLAAVQKGIYLAEGRARFDKLYKTGPAQVRVVLTQGIKRQIRRVLAALGYRVRRLQRVRIGPLGLGGMKPGDFRELNPSEVTALQEAARPSGDAAARREKVSMQAPRVRRFARADSPRPEQRPRAQRRRANSSRA